MISDFLVKVTHTSVSKQSTIGFVRCADSDVALPSPYRVSVLALLINYGELWV